jgi:anti-sigma regulatory factor (Ser/Thr protein kinase)
VCTLPVVDRAVPALRAFVSDAATRWGLSEETVYTVRVIATELVANVLRHSGSPDVTLLVAVDSSAVTIHVSDSGRWRERYGASRAPNEEAEDGRGLSLVRAYATRCHIDKTSRGTTVCVEVEEEPLPPAPAAHIA